MQDWEDWIRTNKPKLKHIANFEERFVREILMRIPELSPEDVIAQYHFQEMDGGNRYIDFCIQNNSKGYFVLIELDGKWKDVTELLERQNTMMASTPGVLLRFVNSTWLNKASLVIQTIRKALSEQNKSFVAKIRTEDLEAKFIKQQESVDALTKKLNELKNDTSKPVDNTQGNLKKSHIFLISSMFVFMIVLVIYALIHKTNNTNQLDVSTLNKNTPQISTTSNDVIGFDPNNYDNDVIYAKNANEYIGETWVVCGNVVEIKTINNRTYLNMDNTYPNQVFTVVIWPDAINRVGSILDIVEGKLLCIRGNITEYKGTPQISLNDLSQLGM